MLGEVMLCFASLACFEGQYFKEHLDISLSATLKGGQGCLMSSTLSGISELPFDSPFQSPLWFFCLDVLLFLSCHFSANGPFS